MIKIQYKEHEIIELKFFFIIFFRVEKSQVFTWLEYKST